MPLLLFHLTYSVSVTVIVLVIDVVHVYISDVLVDWFDMSAVCFVC